MAINLKSYSFDGPHGDINALRAESGVYAILGKRPADAQYRVIDIGESHNIRERVGSHDREPCWKRQQVRLFVAALYCNETTRMQVEHDLRASFDPPCGKK